MNRVGLLLVTLLFFASCGGLDSRSPGGSYGPYFWRAQKAGKTSYLFGTFHYGIALKSLQCSGQIKDTLESSDYFFTEADTDTEEEEDLSDKELEKRLQLLRSKLKQVVSAEDGREFKSFNKDTQVFFLSRSIPENLSYYGYMLMLSELCVNQAVFKMDAGAISIDLELKGLARVNDIPTEYLDEGVDMREVTSALYFDDSIGKVDKKDVEQGVSDFDACVAQFIQLADMYKEGNMSLPEEEGGEQQDIVFKNRNALWVKKFKKSRARRDQVFLAGGAAHFIGPDNVLDMLKEDGFTIERMTSSCGF